MRQPRGIPVGRCHFDERIAVDLKERRAWLAILAREPVRFLEAHDLRIELQGLVKIRDADADVVDPVTRGPVLLRSGRLRQHGADDDARHEKRHAADPFHTSLL